MSYQRHPRSLSAKLCFDVIEKGLSLDSQLAKLPADLDPRDRAFIQNICFGVIRWYWHLEPELTALVKKPIRRKDRILNYVLLVGIYQIKHLNVADHAAVADTVDCCDILNKKWAKGFINACLRTVIKKQKNQEPSKSNEAHELSQHFHSHPEWIARILQSAWPTQYNAILENNNLPAPVCLRVNQAYCSTQDYLSLLNSAHTIADPDPYSTIGIRLKKSIPINELPKFDLGWASIQDTASQLVSNYITLQKGDRFLDACAAPGGKTALLMENAINKNEVTMHALDVGSQRNEKLKETLSRLNFDNKVTVLEGDASDTSSWWDGKKYSKILLDAPCTGSGVIRRHPDIKHHRTGEDLDQLIQVQANILNALWELLEDGGRLLYTTCSVFPKENERQMQKFISSNANASLVDIDHPTGIKLEHGIQTLPGISDMDGFFYCLIEKINKK